MLRPWINALKLEAAKEAAIKAEDFTKAADIKKSIEETKQKIKETDQKEKSLPRLMMWHNRLNV